MSHSLRTPHLESGSSSAVLRLGDGPQGSNPALPGSLGGWVGVLSRCDIGDPGSKIRGQKVVKKGSKNSNPFFLVQNSNVPNIWTPHGVRGLKIVFAGRRWASDCPQKRLRRACSRVHPLIVWWPHIMPRQSEPDWHCF